MKKVLFVIGCVLMSINGFGQFQNGSFEQWDSTFTAAYQWELDSVFQVPGATSGWVSNWSYDYPYGICRTTDARDGNYALMLHNWYGYAYQSIEYKDTTSLFPLFISGYYQYITETLGWPDPHAMADVYVLDSNGDTVGTGSYLFDPMPSYAFFEFPVNFSVTPAAIDSVIVRFTNADQTCQGNIICNFFYLDQLAMTPNGQMGINENIQLNMSVYPNPSSGVFSIESEEPIQSIEVYDTGGKSVEFKWDNRSLYIDDPGVYYLRVTDEKGSSVVKKLSVTR